MFRTILKFPKSHDVPESTCEIFFQDLRDIKMTNVDENVMFNEDYES